MNAALTIRACCWKPQLRLPVKKEFPNKESCFILGNRNIVLIFDADAVDYALERQDMKTVKQEENHYAVH